MANPVYGDRVQETFTTTGTGTISLGGPVVGYQAFSNVVPNAGTCYYGATDGTNWEIGLGTYTSSGDTLARTTIIASSNSNAAVNWLAGTKSIWLDLPASLVAVGQMLGTNTNDAANAGNVGESVSSVVAFAGAVGLVNGTAKTITSIILTPGDWDVNIQGYFQGASNTVFDYGAVSISEVTNTLDTSVGKYTYIFGASGTPFSALSSQVSCNVTPFRLSLAATTTIYFVAQSAFTTAACNVFGIINARRAR